jgi:small subunit ribosomal protein S13
MENKNESKQNKPASRPEIKQPAMPKQSENFRYIVRIMNTDLDGNRSIGDSIRKIKGIGFIFANAVCIKAGVNKSAKTGELPEADVKRLEDAITSAASAFPSWMLNRRKNPETAEPLHLVTTDLAFAQENDIRQLKRIRCYRGVRHMLNAPVRGQRTRSNFRRNKGKVLGVSKQKQTGKTA